MWSNLGISLHFPSVCVSACVHASAQVCVCASFVDVRACAYA